MEYNPRLIEKKWQEIWKKNKSFEPQDDYKRPKKYILSMFPYPSGQIHMGHVRNYCIGDALARHYRQDGYNVLHPIGWDAFGLPAENAAIKHKTHPKDWTYNNIAHMRKELETLGLSFSHQREFATCDPIYSRWEQSLFIEMWKKGLVYRKKGFLNWCPHDQTVLANEQVINGRCWRCDTEVVQREMYQYYLKITAYAKELLESLDSLQGAWPNQVITMQQNWIGQSEGLEFDFRLDSESIQKLNGKFTAFSVFTTRPDTLYGVSIATLAVEHPIVQFMLQSNLLEPNIIKALTKMQNTTAKERAMLPKEGFALGISAIHPLSGEKIPIWVANYVLMEYGSGAVMVVPAHDERDFEFATSFNLPIKQVIESDNSSSLPYCQKEGKLIHSDFLNGLTPTEAAIKVIQHFEKEKKGQKITHYRLRDWGISRQRYWGTPIPLISCQQCGIVPEKDENLPVTLPLDIQIDGEGNPLEKHDTFKNCLCPQCGKPATRETDTMDTFMESSWYFLRYTTPPHLWEKQAFDEDSQQYWLGIDEYIGGIEHAILHLLYARFFTKVLRDMKKTHINEPFSHLLTQGMVLKDGAKMSKSKGNIVNPSDIINTYGADSARLFILFAAPPTKELEWNDNALEGAFRFIKRLFQKADSVQKTSQIPKIETKNLNAMEKLGRKKVYEALLKANNIYERKNEYAFNTLIATCMEAFNALNAQTNIQVLTEGYFILLRLLEPIIPHTASELSEILFQQTNFYCHIPLDTDALNSDSIKFAITINGKKRGEIEVDTECPQEEVLHLAKIEVAKWLENMQIIKEIIVPNKLVNFVIKP
ncbi:leucine--tRNA ligase [Helicobacter monodelphidis]|uniref:leucine--tRNA ligase n=1 Tax=Helicobacter sp. 15-1451 TaxID=2004995 RepID=UPI000DCED030|nr:leucine--tRNA ligase [Helicobacter sp. 15-1451]RAX57906.1 leucine--tRNA ligase [Helicobacter sp. 15-1451]